MTTVTRPRSSGAPEGTRPARAADLVAAEWIKLWSLRSTRWLLLCAMIVAVGIGATVAHADADQLATLSAAQRARFDPLPDPFVGFLIAQLIVASLGALVFTGEYASGSIRATVTAVPARRAMLAAKSVNLAVVTAGIATLTVLATFWIGQAFLSSSQVGLSIADQAAQRAVLAAIVYLVAAALLGLGLGALLRSGAAAISVLVGVLFVAPELLRGSSPWMIDVGNLLPGIAIRPLISVHTWAGAPSVPAAYLVILGYPVLTLIAASIVVRHRDI